MSSKTIQETPGNQEVRPLGHFLFSYLYNIGVRYCFGMPGDYILPLFKALEETPGIDAVVATHEPCAAFSADAYGRLAGLGVLLVTYGVGGFNAMNGVAGAYAESSPLLVISGGPRRDAADAATYLAPATHHYVKHQASQLEAYRHVTDLALRIKAPETAAATIRRAATHAKKLKLPVYLEIPTDLMQADIPACNQENLEEPEDDKVADGVVSLFLDQMYAARNPVLVVGEEVGRHGLQAQVRRIMKARNIPVATSVLGKGIFDETEAGMLGVYAGAISGTPEVRKIVEEADLVVLLGVKMTDVNCGIFTADLVRERTLVAKSGWLGNGTMRLSGNIPFDRFVTTLADRILPAESLRAWPSPPVADYSDSRGLMDQYLALIEAHLNDRSVVIADTGDACYGSLFMTTRRDNGYLAPTFYNTMGFAVPAALGVQLADPECRPVVLVGDGAFQMTGLEFSNLASRGLNPIVVVFNNSGYATQRIFTDGDFNDIKQWNYARIVDLVGGGKSWRVTTAQEMENALQAAIEFTQGPSLIEAVVEKGEMSAGLRRFGQALRREKTGMCPLNESSVPCTHQDHCGFCRAAIWE
jgi:TPP-dependent 2-oxoacid decarboxylase